MSVDFRLARIFCVTAPIHLREPAHCDVSCREPVSSQAHLQNLGRLRPIDRDSESVTYVNTRPPPHAPIERLTLKSPSRASRGYFAQYEIAEESQADVGLKRYFRPILRCSRSEYRSTPSLEAPCLGAKISVSNSPATSTHGFLEQRSAI